MSISTLGVFRVRGSRHVIPKDLAKRLVYLPGTDAPVATAGTVRSLEPRARWLAFDPLDIDLTDAGRRLHRTWAATVSEPLPDDVLHEVLLSLAGRPQVALEYMGRGRIPLEAHLPDERARIEEFDIAGGRRAYLFRRLREGDARMARTDLQFAEFASWLRDDDARLVVSLSGGGFRLFATTPALKVVEALLDGDRSRVAEVWGCSGGAFAGYAFAAGHRLSLLDEFGYDLYNKRLPGLVTGSVGSLARGFVRAQRHRLRGRAVPAEMVEWLTELERREPRELRGDPIPFYALATSTDRGGPYALAAPEHCDALHEDFLIPSDPWLAVAASTAVPFLVRAVRGIGPTADEQWIDGSIADETPLYLPFLKWQRERARSPSTTPARLKILLVHLNLRSSESGVVTTLSRFAPTRATLVKAARLVDTVLDTKTSMVLDMLGSHPQVEVLCAKLSLGWLGLHSPAEIPRAIRTGRTLESWSFTRHPAPA